MFWVGLKVPIISYMYSFHKFLLQTYVTNNTYLVMYLKNFTSQTQFQSYNYKYLTESCSYNFRSSTSTSKSSWQQAMFHFWVPESKSSSCWGAMGAKNMMRFVAGLTKFDGIRKVAMKQVV